MSMLHPEFETLSQTEIRRLQDNLWRHQWEYVRHRSEFYKNKFGQLISGKNTFLENLEELPFTEKDELRISQEGAYPYGDYIACESEKVARIQITSGTTGKPLILANTRDDLSWISRIGGRAFYASGLRPNDRVVHCLNYCLWTGGLTDHLNLEAAGASVVPFGVGNVDQLLDTILDLKITAISCTPSYPALLEQRLEQRGLKPKDLGLKLALFGGEPGLDDVNFRTKLENTWGFAVRNANYGMSEVMSILASQTATSNDLCFHASDAVFVELIDADGTSLPIVEGNTGELVCTHLRKECQPLIRYRTRDLITITQSEPSLSGRSSWRFRVVGRADDMFNVRGVNVFPGAIQRIIREHSDISTGEFRIQLVGKGPWDYISLKVEAARDLSENQWSGAISSLEKSIKKIIGATAKITLIPADTLPRTAGKTQLIERT